MKNWVKIIFIITVLIILVPIILYLLKFASPKLSSDLNIWSMFSQYIEGTIGTLIAFLTMIITTWIAIEFNDFQKQQTTIQLFKEFRAELLDARSKAWEVKMKWYDKNETNYQNSFIDAMIEENYRDKNSEITDEQIQSVYDLFAFYSMLSTYNRKKKVMGQLNYFYYDWWRKFLYDVAEKYDSARKDNISDEIEDETFMKNISYKLKLQKLDNICGFSTFFDTNEAPIDIYKKEP
jgi:hypothetical protein